MDCDDASIEGQRAFQVESMEGRIPVTDQS
jgi:hypothetical protein